MRLSVLDQLPVRQGVTPRDALFETIELARHIDGLGYRRYWLAEHHGSAGLAGAAPEIMVALVAAETKHLRVGSGGVMLSHYSSLKVAEQFRMLETLNRGRIDLGIWQGIFAVLVGCADPPAVVMIDGTAVKAHRAASGAKGGRKTRQSAARAAGARPRSTSSSTPGTARSRSG